jgi:hypothetical protein
MDSVQVEMRCKRNPNPNPISKGVGYLTLAAATGSIIRLWEEDLVVAESAVVVDDALQEGPRATVRPPLLAGSDFVGVREGDPTLADGQP